MWILNVINIIASFHTAQGVYICDAVEGFTIAILFVLLLCTTMNDTKIKNLKPFKYKVIFWKAIIMTNWIIYFPIFHKIYISIIVMGSDGMTIRLRGAPCRSYRFCKTAILCVHIVWIELHQWTWAERIRAPVCICQ